MEEELTSYSATADGPPLRQAGYGQAAVLVIAAFLPILAIVSLAPAVPSILDHFKDEPNALLLVPMMVSAPGLMIALLSPLAGIMADRYGRRDILLAATLLYGAVGISPLFLDNLTLVFATRLVLGVAEAVLLTVTNTLIADYFDTKWRRRVLTIQAVVGPLFGTAVIILSGAFTGQFWNGAFLLYAVAFPIFVAMLFLIHEPVREPGGQAKTTAARFPWRSALTFSGVTFFAAMIYYVFIIQGGLALHEVGVGSPERLGLLISIASVGVPIGGLLFGHFSKHWSVAAQVAAFLALLGLGLMGIGLARDSYTATGLAVVQQVGAGMTVPVLIFWAQSVLPAEHRGRGLGLWSAAFFLGQFGSPVMVSAARQLSGSTQGAFLALGVLAIAGAATALTLSRRR
jgi:MFS family permease